METTGSMPLLLWWYTFLSTLRSYETRVVEFLGGNSTPFIAVLEHIHPSHLTLRHDRLSFGQSSGGNSPRLFSHWYTHIPLSIYVTEEFWTVNRWEFHLLVLTLVHTYTPLSLRDRRVLDSQQVGTPPVCSHTGTHIYPSQLSYTTTEFWTFIRWEHHPFRCTGTHIALLNFTPVQDKSSEVWRQLHPFVGVLVHT